MACTHIQKSYGDMPVLRDVTFHLERREHAALIGANGAGKSTLLQILDRTEMPDSGQLVYSGSPRIGMLSQLPEATQTTTILEEVQKARQELLQLENELQQMEEALPSVPVEEQTAFLEEYQRQQEDFTRRRGFAAPGEIAGVLRGLGFSDDEFSRPLHTLSGGQRVRVVLARLLLEAPDFLLLDEPTNHLDASALRWLEDRLRKYPGTLLVVSHDRYFLDRIADRIIELEQGHALVYVGNYSVFREKKQAAQHARQKAWEKQLSEIRHQEEVIRRLRQFNREKSIRRAESREKQLSRIERLEKPQEASTEMRLSFPVSLESGHDVLQVSHLQKGFTTIPLFSDIHFSLRKGERVALIGENGAGKSTLLKILCGQLEADIGEVHLGAHVRPAVYDQEQQLLHPEKTVLEEVADRYPRLPTAQIRSTLAGFLFTQEAVFKPIAVLSGGERARLSLALMMLSGANLLLLDEPTNHLDIPSREVLEEALLAYHGTALYVSHDRYFINRTATRILELRDGHLTSYTGNYDAYQEKHLPSAEKEHRSKTPASAGRRDWQQQKQAAARWRRQQQTLADCEKAISQKEERQKEIDALLQQPETGTDVDFLQKLAQEQSILQGELEALYTRWEELAEQADSSSGQS